MVMINGDHDIHRAAAAGGKTLEQMRVEKRHEEFSQAAHELVTKTRPDMLIMIAIDDIGAFIVTKSNGGERVSKAQIALAALNLQAMAMQ